MRIKRILLTALIIVLTITYYLSDCKLYYFGQSKYNICNNKLPINLFPDFWDTDISYPMVGFVLKNSYGIVLVGEKSNFDYNNDTIVVGKIYKYGFSDNSIIVFFEDVNNKKFYIKYLNSLKNNDKIYHEIHQIGENLDIIEENYNWIDISDTYHIEIIKLVRTYSGSLMIILLLVIFYYVIRRIIRKQPSAKGETFK